MPKMYSPVDVSQFQSPTQQLPAAQQQARQATFQPVDVAGAPRQPEHPGFFGEVSDALKGLLGGTGEALQKFGLAARGSTPIGLVGPQIKASMERRADPEFLHYNIPAHLGMGPTVGGEIGEAVGQAIPLMGLSMAGGGATLPEMAASAGLQGAIQAQEHPAHPIAGMGLGALSDLTGGLASNLLSRTAPAVAKESLGRLADFGKKLGTEKAAQYKILEQLGDANLIGEPKSNIQRAFGNIFSPDEAADYLASLKHEGAAMPDYMQKISAQMEPDFTDDVMSKIDPRTLRGFERHFGTGKAADEVAEFAKNPTASQAGVTLRALTKARKGDPDLDRFVRDMRDQIKENIIFPGVERLASPEDVDAYSKADVNHAIFKHLFGQDPLLESIGEGHVSPDDLTASQYANILRKAKLGGAFAPTGYLDVPELPMKEFEAMKRAQIAPSRFQQMLNKHAGLLQFGTYLSPAVRSGLLSEIPQ